MYSRRLVFEERFPASGPIEPIALMRLLHEFPGKLLLEPSVVDMPNERTLSSRRF